MKEKCVYCEKDNFSEDEALFPFVNSFDLPGIGKEFDIASLGYSLVICANCVLGLSFITVSMLLCDGAIKLANTKDTGHSLVSESIRLAGEEYFRRLSQLRERKVHGLSVVY